MKAALKVILIIVIIVLVLVLATLVWIRTERAGQVQGGAVLDMVKGQPLGIGSVTGAATAAIDTQLSALRDAAVDLQTNYDAWYPQIAYAARATTLLARRDIAKISPLVSRVIDQYRRYRAGSGNIPSPRIQADLDEIARLGTNVSGSVVLSVVPYPVAPPNGNTLIANAAAVTRAARAVTPNTLTAVAPPPLRPGIIAPPGTAAARRAGPPIVLPAPAAPRAVIGPLRGLPPPPPPLAPAPSQVEVTSDLLLVRKDRPGHGGLPMNGKTLNVATDVQGASRGDSLLVARSLQEARDYAKALKGTPNAFILIVDREGNMAPLIEAVEVNLGSNLPNKPPAHRAAALSATGWLFVATDDGLLKHRDYIDPSHYALPDLNAKKA